MATTTATREIRALRRFSRLSEGDLFSRGSAVQKGLTANPDYPTPPVDPTTLKAALDTYSADITAALDGSKTAIAAKQKQARVIYYMLRQLAAYVDAHTDGDMARFMTTGFLPAPTTRPPAQPLAQPVIRKIKQGASGELKVTVSTLSGAVHYELRYAELSGGVPGSWTVETLTKVRPPASVNGLTPGTIYAFQVRALGRLGFTAWSDSTTCMTT